MAAATPDFLDNFTWHPGGTREADMWQVPRAVRRRRRGGRVMGRQPLRRGRRDPRHRSASPGAPGPDSPAGRLEADDSGRQDPAAFHGGAAIRARAPRAADAEGPVGCAAAATPPRRLPCPRLRETSPSSPWRSRSARGRAPSEGASRSSGLRRQPTCPARNSASTTPRRSPPIRRAPCTRHGSATTTVARS